MVDGQLEKWVLDSAEDSKILEKLMPGLTKRTANGVCYFEATIEQAKAYKNLVTSYKTGQSAQKFSDLEGFVEERGTKKKKGGEAIMPLEELEKEIEKTKNQYVAAGVTQVATGVGVFISLTDMAKTTIDQIFFGDWTDKDTFEYTTRINNDVVIGALTFLLYLSASYVANYLKNYIIIYEMARITRELTKE